MYCVHTCSFTAGAHGSLLGTEDALCIYFKLWSAFPGKWCLVTITARALMHMGLLVWSHNLAWDSISQPHAFTRTRMLAREEVKVALNRSNLIRTPSQFFPGQRNYYCMCVCAKSCAHTQATCMYISDMMQKDLLLNTVNLSQEWNSVLCCVLCSCLDCFHFTRSWFWSLLSPGTLLLHFTSLNDLSSILFFSVLSWTSCPPVLRHINTGLFCFVLLITVGFQDAWGELVRPDCLE